MRLQGIVPILATPFDADRRLVAAELAREVEWLVSTGVDGLGIAIASELFALADDEWAAAVRTTVDAVAGAVPIVASVGREDASDAAARAARAAELGATVAMAYPPRQRTLDVEGLVAYYGAIATAGLDVWIQDAPQLVGVELPVQTLQAIASAVPTVAGLKIEAAPTAEKVAAVRSALGDGPVVLGGSGGFVFPDELEAGAEGTMPGVAPVQRFVATWRAWSEGGAQAARDSHERGRDAWRFSASRAGAFVYMQKLALVRAGIFSTTVCRFGDVRLEAGEARQWLALLDAALDGLPGARA